MDIIFSNFCTSYQKHIVCLKQSGELKDTEGKSPFSMTSLHLILQLFNKQTKLFYESIFSHTYMILSHLLINRVESTGSIMISKMRRLNDW